MEINTRNFNRHRKMKIKEKKNVRERKENEKG
jgi:hypothetical protein